MTVLLSKSTKQMSSSWFSFHLPPNSSKSICSMENVHVVISTKIETHSVYFVANYTTNGAYKDHFGLLWRYAHGEGGLTVLLQSDKGWLNVGTNEALRFASNMGMMPGDAGARCWIEPKSCLVSAALSLSLSPLFPQLVLNFSMFDVARIVSCWALFDNTLHAPPIELPKQAHHTMNMDSKWKQKQIAQHPPKCLSLNRC